MKEWQAHIHTRDTPVPLMPVGQKGTGTSFAWVQRSKFSPSIISWSHTLSVWKFKLSLTPPLCRDEFDQTEAPTSHQDLLGLSGDTGSAVPSHQIPNLTSEIQNVSQQQEHLEAKESTRARFVSCWFVWVVRRRNTNRKESAVWALRRQRTQGFTTVPVCVSSCRFKLNHK